MPGEFDRYNMKRELSLAANIVGADLGSVATQVIAAVDRVQKDDDAAKDELDNTDNLWLFFILLIRKCQD